MFSTLPLDGASASVFAQYSLLRHDERRLRPR